MLWLIKDKTKNFLGRETKTVVKVCLNENEVTSFLGSVKNLKCFKGDIEVERVVL